MINLELLNNIPPRAKVIGVPISAVNMQSCVDFILDNWEGVHGNYICVSNVHTTVMAHDNSDYYKVQANSLLSIPDGKPLSIVGRKQYHFMERVTGPDLMRKVFELSKNKEIRHYFYGTSQDNLNALLNKIESEYPWVNVIGSEPSVFRKMTKKEEEELANRINATKPDFVWVALGAPRQEEFCYRNEGKINGLMVGVGGAFNVISGVIDEAPRWMQNISMEWFYRFVKEPRRLFKRYFITNSKFLWYLFCKSEE